MRHHAPFASEERILHFAKHRFSATLVAELKKEPVFAEDSALTAVASPNVVSEEETAPPTTAPPTTEPPTDAPGNGVNAACMAAVETACATKSSTAGCTNAYASVFGSHGLLPNLCQSHVLDLVTLYHLFIFN